MQLSHEVFLALAYVSQISDLDSIRSRFIESLNGLDKGFVFKYVDHRPPGIPEYRILPIATLRSTFGYALLEKFPEKAEAERAVFKSAFQFLAVILENRMQTRTLESRAESLSQEIRQEKSNIRTLLDTLPVGVWVADENGTIILGNPAGEKIWSGIRYIGLAHYGEYKAWWPGTGKRVEAEEWGLAQAIKAGKSSTDQEVEIECFDGTLKTILNSAAPLLDAEHRVIGAVAVNQDITERKEAEKALRESEEQFKAMFEMASIGMAQADPKTGRWLRVNHKLCEITGYSSSEMLAMHIPEITHPEDQERDWEAFQDVINNKSKNYRLEKRYIRKDGTTIWVNVNMTVIRDAAGEPVRTMATIEDVTERKLAEAERERLMAAIEQAGEIVVVTDPNGSIQYVNPAFETITGYTREEALGQNPRILKSGAHDNAFYRDLWATLASGKTWTGRIVNKRKNGKLYTEEATISPVCDAKGKIVNYVGVKRDITEHLNLSQQFEQAQKMESVGRLAGGVAHDFNNMLGIILGYTEMAMDKVAPSQPLFGDLQEIRTAAERSRDITRQLLAFARRQTISPVVLDLNATVEGMLKMLRRLIGEDIDLAWLPGRGLWPVNMDPSQLDQLLANLCVNARDAISGVGKLTIETGDVVFQEEYCVDHAGYVPGDYVMLAVSDSGCGMDKETLDKIFEPFFTTKAVGKGTGLGLATVYGIVKQNSGFVNVYSEPGQGTTFRVYIPRHAGSSIEIGLASQSELPLGRGETVLLVEDETAILDMGKRMLERLGYTVLAASKPGDAIRLTEAYSGKIHLLMTDVVMPEMNGRDLAERMQALCPGLKCLFMSGYTANVIAHHGVLDPGVIFIQKPFSMMNLASKVREALEAGA